MKKSLTGVVALLAGAFVAHSQGAVSLGNYSLLSTYIYVSLGSTLLGGTNTVTTGVPKLDVGNGDDWTVALWGNVGVGHSSASLEANGNLATATLENGVGDSDPGTWFTTQWAVIPGTTYPPQLVSIQLAAWYNDGGAITSYAAAQAAGVPVGLSAIGTVWTYQELESNPPPPPYPVGLPDGLGNIVLSLPRPQLSIIQNGTNVILTWPTNVAGFNLEFAANLGSPTAWGKVSFAPVVVNGQNAVTNIISGAQQFFRLTKL